MSDLTPDPAAGKRRGEAAIRRGEQIHERNKGGGDWAATDPSPAEAKRRAERAIDAGIARHRAAE